MTDQLRCDACKHWINVNDEFALKKHNKDDFQSYDFNVGYCIKIKELWNVTTWTEISDDTVRVLLPEFKDLKMFTQDASNYKADLLTKEDFFCFHHETKV